MSNAKNSNILNRPDILENVIHEKERLLSEYLDNVRNHLQPKLECIFSELEKHKRVCLLFEMYSKDYIEYCENDDSNFILLKEMMETFRGKIHNYYIQKMFKINSSEKPIRILKCKPFFYHKVYYIVQTAEVFPIWSDKEGLTTTSSDRKFMFLKQIYMYDKCVICYEDMGRTLKDGVLYQCMHYCVCRQCDNDSEKILVSDGETCQRCPVCRKKVIHKIYYPSL